MGYGTLSFAQTVIPLRKMMYPRVQDKIEKSKILKREKVFLYKEFRKTYKSNI